MRRKARLWRATCVPSAAVRRFRLEDDAALAVFGSWQSFPQAAHSNDLKRLPSSLQANTIDVYSYDLVSCSTRTKLERERFTRVCVCGKDTSVVISVQATPRGERLWSGRIEPICQRRRAMRDVLSHSSPHGQKVCGFENGTNHVEILCPAIPALQHLSRRLTVFSPVMKIASYSCTVTQPTLVGARSADLWVARKPAGFPHARIQLFLSTPAASYRSLRLYCPYSFSRTWTTYQQE